MEKGVIRIISEGYIVSVRKGEGVFSNHEALAVSMTVALAQGRDQVRWVRK